jgi:para-nitrobenzyl esterase
MSETIEIQGISYPGYTLYKGIPYATAKRFEKPQLTSLASISAQEWPAIAWQLPFEGGTFYDKEFYEDQPQPQMSEDCLYINLWVPENAQNAPVAMWIHGGGFDHGYSYEKEFDGAAYAKEGIIVATISYRVGALGFLVTHEQSQGNLGLYDQLAALEWLHKNIGFFGGDPKNLTVFGQSAGCMSTLSLVRSPLTAGLISKAILQSGLGIEGVVSKEQAAKTGEKFLEFAGISEEELKTIDPKELTEKSFAFLAEHPLAFAPCYDGEFFSKEDQPAKIPYVFGSTFNDIFTENPADENRGMLYEGCLAFGRQMLEEKYPASYMYDFVHPLPGDDAGSFHSSELWYMFGTYPRCWRPMQKEDEELSANMIKAWTSFIKHSDPGWQSYPYIQIYR